MIVLTAACLPAAVFNGALTTFGSGGTGKGYAVFSLVILSPWAFAGFEVTSFDTAHFKFPIRRSWPLIVLSIVVAAFAYASMTLVSVSAVPDDFATWQEYIDALDGLTGIPSVPTFFAAGHFMGTAGVVIMIATALSAILTGIIGGYRATTRVLSTMAEDRILSEHFSKTSYSILFIMVICTVIAFLGRNTLNWFIDLTAFGAIVGFGYTSAAAWKIAKAEGCGTEIILRFKFRLAEKEEFRNESVAGKAAGDETVDFTGKRLLLVEDNTVNMEIAKMILEQIGFTLKTAENGQVAVDMVAASQPGHFDAVLMDIQMPIMDGYAATRAIRALNNTALASVPILAMTANAFQEDVQAAMDAGMQAHIAKPIDIGALTKTLRSVLRS